jgi:hypothetical protein
MMEKLKITGNLSQVPVFKREQVEVDGDEILGKNEITAEFGPENEESRTENPKPCVMQ